MATKRVWSTFSRRDRRRTRIRRKVRGTAAQPRLCVFRSLRHIYAQIVNDEVGGVMVSASSREKAVAGSHQGGKKEQAQMVGKLLAERARDKQIERVSFDRSGYLFHGRVRALAEAAREAGLVF